MSLSVGIVGLPNAGKSTLFNALLSRQIANCAPYPFCTIEPNIGVVEVPDERLAILAKIVNTEKLVPAIVEFKDIAGLVAGASKGEGLGNKFLANIRECQAIVHVLRAFKDPNVARESEVNPLADFEIVKTELCLADLQTLEKQQPVNPSVATKDDIKRWETILKLRKILEQGIEVRKEKWDEDEQKIINTLFLLTAKPALFVLNIDEEEIIAEPEKMKQKFGFTEEIIPICAKIEMELAELNPEERKNYLKELGLRESGLEKLIKKGYGVLGLQTFLTAGEKEVRAWTIHQGDTAPQAAGVIHTDFEKGFIKAQVCSYNDFVKYSGWKGAGDAGKVRLEGKGYLMKEGDVVEFKFNL
ncbi:MAG: Ribosome-binding ATPase YchF [Microgenomates group bacterium ADurb.Bin219]|nr:MAG: Ribosome-binding ATPase YchF [Microgenomates group bacterium ADurb.Bin219]HNP89329.1 redox-regulated ATPase YchF [Candidatus Woesebacteria bacterium]